MHKHNDKSLDDKILEVLLNKIANDCGLYIVKISFLSLRNNSIEVMIDRIDENKVSISDCTLFNSAVKNYESDISKILGNDYYFDISSPGVERPLVKLSDYDKYKNHIILVKFKERIDNKKKLQGKLIGVENDKIKLENNGKMIMIEYSNIQAANLVMTEEIFRKLLSK